MATYAMPKHPCRAWWAALALAFVAGCATTPGDRAAPAKPKLIVLLVVDARAGIFPDRIVEAAR